LQLGIHCDSTTQGEFVFYGDLFIDCLDENADFDLMEGAGATDDGIVDYRYTCSKSVTFPAGSTSRQTKIIPSVGISTDLYWSLNPDEACYRTRGTAVVPSAPARVPKAPVKAAPVKAGAPKSPVKAPAQAGAPKAPVKPIIPTTPVRTPPKVAPPVFIPALNPPCYICGDGGVSTITKPYVIVPLPTFVGIPESSCSTLLTAAEVSLLIPKASCPLLQSEAIRLACG
jgi:hypothetical protein